MFNGKKAHEALSFTGIRFSIIAFTCPRCELIAPVDLARAAQCGFRVPAVGDINNLWRLLEVGPTIFDCQHLIVQRNKARASTLRQTRHSLASNASNVSRPQEPIQSCLLFCSNCLVRRCTCVSNSVVPCDSLCSGCRRSQVS